MFLPTRDASVADLIANVAGAALGGGLAIAFARSPRATRSLASARDRWFLPGIAGDLGLALLAIWLAVQVNPGIPLFATVYDCAARPFVEPASDDVAATLVGSAHSAFQLLGVGLFVALLMRERRHVAGAVLLLIGAAAIVKGVAATVLLNPAAWEHWLTPAVALGVLIGSILLALAIRLPRSAQVTLATIALLSSLLATLFAPDLLFARAPVGLFNGPYGHLLNFNGLTHTVLLLWPAVASGFLFALAGRPGWGEPGLNGPHAHSVRCPRGGASALRAAARALNGPHAHSVRCPPRGRKCASERAARALRHAPARGRASRQRALDRRDDRRERQLAQAIGKTRDMLVAALAHAGNTRADALDQFDIAHRLHADPAPR